MKSISALIKNLEKWKGKSYLLELENKRLKTQLKRMKSIHGTYSENSREVARKKYSRGD